MLRKRFSGWRFEMQSLTPRLNRFGDSREINWRLHHETALVGQRY
jgi:hypothetical protein